MRIRERMATVTTDAITPTTFADRRPQPCADAIGHLLELRHRSRVEPMRPPAPRAARRHPTGSRGPCSTRSGTKASTMTSRTMTPIRKNSARREGRGLRLRPSTRAEPADQRRERGRHDQREQHRDRDRPEQDGQPDRDGGKARDGEQPPAECAEAAQPPWDDDRVSWDGCRHDTPSTHRSGWTMASPRDRRCRPSRPEREQDRPGVYLPAARASACSLIVANSSAVIAPDAWSLPAFSISSAAESRV